MVECVAHATENVVVVKLYLPFNNVAVKLPVLSHLRSRPAAAVYMIDFQKGKFVTAAGGTAPASQQVYRTLTNPLMLLAPFTPLLFRVVIGALSSAFAVCSHIFPHVLAVLPAAFLRRPITTVFLCHAASVSPNKRFVLVRRPGKMTKAERRKNIGER